MTPQDYFHQNITILREKQPELAELLQNTPCNQWQFCLTEKGEGNLKKTQNGTVSYYHSMKGAVDELKGWALEHWIPLRNYVIFYGVGLGHIYEALREWFGLDARRYLVILEDDLEVIHRLLETEMGGIILRDDRVQLYYFRDYQKDFNLIQKVLWSTVTIPYGINIVFGATSFYQQERKEKAAEIEGYIRGNIENIDRIKEAITPAFGVMRNFFYNLHNLPNAYYAHRLQNKFTDVPAIICGGGPSLDQQIEVLRKFENRALIFAIGAGSNILSHYQLLPDCNFGIDPKVIHYSRMLTQLTFEIPYGYYQRIHHEGIRAIQAPYVYFSKRDEDPEGWFDRQLGLENTDALEINLPGISVGTFCLNSIAALGCNPIILIGIDLSHIQQRHYSHGVVDHPLITQKKDFDKLGDPTYILLSENNKITTTVQFIREQQWFEEFAKASSKIRLINASVGGMPIEGFEHLSLEEAEKQIQQKSYDLRGMLHSEIFQSKIPQITPEVINLLIEEWEEIMQHIAKLCDHINQELMQDAEGQPSSQALTLMQELEQSAGYQCWLGPSAWVVRSILEIKKELWGQQITNERLCIVYSLLKEKALSVIKAIQQTKANERKTYDRKWPCYPPLQGIAKEQMVEENLTPPQESEPQYHFFPSGQLQSVQYYQGEVLHGPSLFYSAYGRVIARSYFINGKKEKHSCLYYNSGAIYAIESYTQGKRDGKQKYFYEDGAKRTFIEYDNGVLQGDLWEYYPEGNLKREMHFQDGLRNGYERLWSEEAKLRLEMQWKEDKPSGMGRLWREDGTLELEADYEKDAAKPTVHHYEQKDILLEQVGEVTDSALKLKMKMEKAMTQLGNIDWDKMDPLLKKEMQEQIKEAGEKLHDIRKRLKKNGEYKPL